MLSREYSVRSNVRASEESEKKAQSNNSLETDLSQWYLAHTLPRAERKGAINLEQQGFGVYLPCYLARRSHARRRDWVEKPIFPGYLFVNFDPGRDRWRAVHSTVGIRHLVSAGDRPLTVSTKVIQEIRSREDSRGYIILSSGCEFRRGDRVQITEGPLLDSFGLFDARCDDERVIILLDLLGRQVKVRVPAAMIMRKV